MTPGRGDRGAGAAWARYLVVALAVFAVSLLLAVYRDSVLYDESWYFQVVRRTHEGEVLYRDVFYGATPLAVYVSRAAMATFGTEIGVMKGVFALCMAATAVLVVTTGRALSIPWQGITFAVAALLACTHFAPLGVGALYPQLASLLTLATLRLVLGSEPSVAPRAAGSRPHLRRALAAAGACAGAAFAAKQNAGLLALLAVCASVAAHGLADAGARRRAATHLTAATAAFVAVGALLLLPVVADGGGPKLLEYGFLAKGTYARAAGVSYVANLAELTRMAAGARTLEDAKLAYPRLIALLPLASLIALLAAWLAERPKRTSTLVVTIFVGASLASAAPRFDDSHLAAVASIPALAVALGWARLAERAAGRWPVALAAAGCVVAAVGPVGATAGVVRRLAAGEDWRLAAPSFRGANFDPLSGELVRAKLSALGELVHPGERVFVLSATAGFYYLACEIRNPTPFDYPLVTALGRGGERGLMEAIERGEVRTVCLERNAPERPTDPLWPSDLEAFIRERMVLVGARGDFELYRLHIESR